MPFQAWDAARDASNSQTRLFLHKKTDGKAAQSNKKKTGKDLLLYVRYFMFASWWQAKSCCLLFLQDIYS